MKMSLKLQRSPQNSCLPTSFAMCCDITVSKFINQSGVQGNSVVWEDLPHPYCIRGWHLQECIITAYKNGYATTVLSPKIYLGPDSEHLTEIDMDFHLVNKRAVLISDKHAVALECKRVYDPKGYIYDYENLKDYEIICLIDKINGQSNEP